MTYYFDLTEPLTLPGCSETIPPGWVVGTRLDRNSKGKPIPAYPRVSSCASLRQLVSYVRGVGGTQLVLSETAFKVLRLELYCGDYWINPGSMLNWVQKHNFCG